MKIVIGWDQREEDAYEVARMSAMLHAGGRVPYPLKLHELQGIGMYTRAVEHRDGRLYDPISEAPMSTEFAISRFLTPRIFRSERWALFVDSDVMFRDDPTKLVAFAEDHQPGKAVYVVKHNFDPPEGTKMDGQAQTRYARKNWSSVMLFDCWHQANRKLDTHLVNSVPGRDLHRFCWLADNEIGELPPRWNYLVGHHSTEDVLHPAIVHFTEGVPSMAGYEACEFADEWRKWLAHTGRHA